MESNCREEKGFTTIELLITISIIVIVIIPIISSLSANIIRLGEARRLTESINLARWKLEKIRGKESSEIINISLSPISNEDFADYKYKVNVEGGERKEVTVEVYWKDQLQTKLVTVVI